MSTVEFGLSVSRVTDIKTVARRVEALGFDYLASGEHVMFHGPVPNAFVRLAVAAGATERIKLLSAITLVPLYPAALLAKLAATLDHDSGGRFNLGVGVGGEYPKEFEAVGVPVGERGARTNEALEVLRRLLTGETVSFEGRFTRFQEGRISPAPIQKPLPIWVAGRKEAAMKRAARYGDVWMPYMYSPQQLEQSRETIRRLAQAEGRDPSSIRTAIYLFTTVYDDEQQARRVAAETVGRNYQQDFNRLVDRYLLAGTPEQCRRRLAEYVAAGADRAILQLACPPEDYDTMLERVAAEIMPAFRRGA